MKPFEHLTVAGQVRRSRGVAQDALGHYGLKATRLRLMRHRENTTFRVDAGDERFLLRLHRPGVQNAEAIRSEMMWLRALSCDTSLVVPEPVAAQDNFVVEARGAGESRLCTLLKWVDGRFGKGTSAHYEALGEAMALLHAHAAQWILPANFVRRRWDYDSLCGANAGFGYGASAWELLPPERRATFERGAQALQNAMKTLGKGPDAWGLIHADLHSGNVLFGGVNRLEARVIDFDDCGPGFWIYDFAVILGGCDKTTFEQSRDALYAGYTRHRALPMGIDEHLNAFRAGRLVTGGLWKVARAQDSPAFRVGLTESLERADQRITDLLKN